MTLAAGTRLGPCEILSPPGAGVPPSLAFASDGAARRSS